MIQSSKNLSAKRRAIPARNEVDGSLDRPAWQSETPPPFVLNQQPAQPVPSINVEQLAATSFAARPLSVLVVEDNRINRVLTLKMLSHLGYAADSANNGRECMDALARKTYHLFLMDLQMPVMDGFTTAREIRRRGHFNPATPPPYICALTANAMAKDRSESLAAGMDEFLTKPVRLEVLKNLLDRVAENLENFQPL
jgi:CheY-like chemotaxis protein